MLACTRSVAIRCVALAPVLTIAVACTDDPVRPNRLGGRPRVRLRRSVRWSDAPRPSVELRQAFGGAIDGGHQLTEGGVRHTAAEPFQAGPELGPQLLASRFSGVYHRAPAR